ncbi:TPA: hypothetical protein VCA04_002346 [Streptococcus suis]|uniref:hypothetical protein n=1 Tax=Streptococcus suis TaxID=1307 RepID=UPI0006B5F206|nr:hypothetical protein [Streptococcus suis]KPA69348.1 hypothetical protein XK29_07430 [Streptococcus suis]MCK3867557.1 hypothetical protein [Streptococcus suis]MCK3976647.1 hypothetical protein [Streptococcus suis]MCK4043199.1 hypothetical protein [Streptococcus suis]MCL4941643.1 hypothetical protein [Streptococcus suis]
MRRYKLNDNFRLRKIDKALFNFSKAELIEFNNTGFDLLLELLEGVERDLNMDELMMLDRLIEGGIIEAIS